VERIVLKRRGVVGRPASGGQACARVQPCPHKDEEKRRRGEEKSKRAPSLRLPEAGGFGMTGKSGGGIVRICYSVAR
jgi:hypothetical protein